MNKTIIAILMVALMIVPMVAFAEAKGPEEISGNQPNVTQPEPPVDGGDGDGTTNISQDRDTLRKQIRDCLEDEGSDCSDVQEMGRAFASGIINKFCGNAEQKMEQMRTRTESVKGLADEEKELFMETIRHQEEKLSQICETFESSAKDKEAIKEAAQQLREIAKETTAKTILAREKVQERRVGLILQRAEQLEVKLERIIEKINSTNLTCAENLSDLKGQFNQKVGEARVIYNESKALRDELMGENFSGNFTSQLREAQTKMQQAQTKLKEAHQTLKEITVQLRGCAQKEMDEENELEEENETGDSENKTEKNESDHEDKDNEDSESENHESEESDNETEIEEPENETEENETED